MKFLQAQETAKDNELNFRFDEIIRNYILESTSEPDVFFTTFSKYALKNLSTTEFENAFIKLNDEQEQDYLATWSDMLTCGDCGEDKDFCSCD